MKKWYVTLWIGLMACMASAQTFTFTSANTQTVDGVTLQLDKGAGQNPPFYNTSGQLRLYASNEVLISGHNVLRVELYWTKPSRQSYITDLTPDVGTLTSGGVSVAVNDTVMDLWTGSVANLTLTLGASGQRVLTKVVVVNDTLNEPTTKPDTEDTGLDSTYVYGEPTVVTNTEAEGNNIPYAFVENNILVECQKGARASTYFSCNAGQKLTLTATRKIKGIALDGEVKRYFEVAASSGIVDYASSNDEDVEGEPVVVVRDIDSTSVTLTCSKQLRCTELRVYFAANPGESITREEKLNYDYEPKEPTQIDEELDLGVFYDFTRDFGRVELFLASVEYQLDIQMVMHKSDPKWGIAPGVYPVNDSYAEGTVISSPGGNADYDYPTVVMTDFREDSYLKAYYVESGTLTVTQAGQGIRMVLEGLSHNGSLIRMAYTGALMDMSGEENVETDIAARKKLEDGRVVILRDGKKYNVLGVLEQAE